MRSIRNTSYMVSEDGKIFNSKTQQYLKGSLDKDGYLRLKINGKNVSFHRMVLETYLPREDASELEVNHINGNKIDNRLENLEWSTRKGNMKHMVQSGLSQNCSHKGEFNPRAKLDKEVVKMMRRDYESGLKSISQLSREFKVGWTTASDIVKRKTWKHLE